MSTVLNRVARCTAAVLAVVAVGAAATACDSGHGSPTKAGAHGGPAQDVSSDGQKGSQDGSSDGSKGGGLPSAGDDASQAPGKDPAKTGQQGSHGDTAGDGSGSGSGSGSDDGRCHTDDLTFLWAKGAPDMETDSQQVAMIRLTNIGKDTCTLRGFPGLSLVSDSGATWDLPRSSDTPSTMTLHPGDDTAVASFNLLPLPSAMKGPTGFKVAHVLVTPPNETKSANIDWPYGGEVLDQSGATHPGTFVNPIGVG